MLGRWGLHSEGQAVLCAVRDGVIVQSAREGLLRFEIDGLHSTMIHDHARLVSKGHTRDDLKSRSQLPHDSADPDFNCGPRLR